jgi:AraC family transcriptional regulator
LIDGRPVENSFTDGSRFSIFPGGTEIEMQFDVEADFEYTVVFFNPAIVNDGIFNPNFTPVLGFCHHELKEGLTKLCGEASRRDRFFEHMVEGWTLQALVHMSRMADLASSPADRERVGSRILAAQLREIDAFVLENLSGPISVADLANVAGFGKRHFARTFVATTGISPHRYVLAKRVDVAKTLLTETSTDLTTLAIDCGFSHSQHLSTAFRNATQITPSEYRRRFRRDFDSD